MSQEAAITLLLRDFAGGDREALDRLVPLLYPELRRLARGYLRKESSNHTLQATALVHEAYARLANQDQPDYRNRAHFMGVAARVMRQILIDHARVRKAEKRNHGARPVPFEEALSAAAEEPSIILAVHEALVELQEKDAVKARLIEMRFFGGMTAEDSAEVLGLPVEQVRRHLRVAQAWLKQRLSEGALGEKNPD